jgi:hypothetical protein
MKVAEVTAVHEEDTLEFLRLLGVGHDYRAGRLLCVVCGTPLREIGVGAARRASSGIFEFSCCRVGCLERFHDNPDRAALPAS